MAFTAADVKNLRERTGCGMMDCKKALTEANGDMDKAIELLREKGLAAAAKKAGRIAAEGIVEAYIHMGGKIGAVNAIIPVYPAEDVTYLMHGDIDTSSIQRVLTLPDSIDAPVAEGQVLGTMEVKLDDVTIATVDLVAGETLERSSWLEFLRKVKGFFSSVWFKLAIVVVLLLIAAYIVFAILYNNRKRRRRKAKRRF